MEEALIANRRNMREEEISLYGKTICHSYVEKNKKAYTRKKKHKNKNDYQW